MTSDEAIIKVARRWIPKNYLKLLIALETRHMTTDQVAELLGIHMSNAYKMIFVLRKLKVVCCVSRVIENNHSIRIYGLGSKDVKFEKKPRALISKENRYRRKVAAGAVRLGMFGA